MKRDPLKDAMARRSPLAPRESVDPVDLYTPSLNGERRDDKGDKLLSQQAALSTNGQDDNGTRQHVHNEIKKPMSEGETPRRRYTTYLKPETIKAIKWLALDRESNDYDVVQEALDEYLRRHKR